MRKNAKSEPLRKAAGQGQLWLRLPGLVREALYETVIAAGLACVDEVLEAERSRFCGARYQHLSERQALRAGHVASSLVLGGRRVAVSRPRARSVDGRELRLPSWREWSTRDPLTERAMEQMMLGGCIDSALCTFSGAAATKRHRAWYQQECGERTVCIWTERKLAELMSRELGSFSLTALLIDGVHFGEHLVLAGGRGR